MRVPEVQERRQRFEPWLANSLLLTLIALAVGVPVYVLDWPAASVYFLPHALSLADGHGPYFGALGGQLPDFSHVYAFILLTTAFSPRRQWLLPIFLFWSVVDTLI